MTGQGTATRSSGHIGIDVEIRTVNNRFLKVIAKVSDVVGSIEHQIESLVREHLKRGSVNVAVRVSNVGRSNASSINRETLEDYLNQTAKIGDRLGIEFQYSLGELLSLPGVLASQTDEVDETLVDEVRQAIIDCLVDLNRMRRVEGELMATQMLDSLTAISVASQRIFERAPETVSEYRNRLESRVRTVLAELGHKTTELDLLREVLIYSDRCDIREELVRLSSHIEQFRAAIAHPESQGRRLDFLTQELLRETNTIGSKANDSEISQQVISIKTTIEQMRELVQNVE